MAGFKGHVDYSVDSKGRVALPAKMRRAINPEASNCVVLTRGFESCIFVYPQDKWEKMEAGFDDLNQYNAEARHFVRIIEMWADDQEIDAQGRITIPKKMMEFAQITDKVTVVGARDRMELWNPEVLDNFMNPLYEQYETLAETVMRGM